MKSRESLHNLVDGPRCGTVGLSDDVFSNVSGKLVFDSVHNQPVDSSTSVLCGLSHLPVWDSQQKCYLKGSVSYIKIRHEKMEMEIEAKNTTYPRSPHTPSL